MNHSHPDTRDVKFPDKEAEFRVETFSIDQLKPAPKLDDKALRARFSQIVSDQVKKTAESYQSSSVQKQIKFPPKQTQGEKDGE